MFLRCIFFFSVVREVTEEMLAVGGVTGENGNGWEEVEFLDEDRDIDLEVWIVFIFLSRYMYRRDYVRTDVRCRGHLGCPFSCPSLYFQFFLSFGTS